MACHKQVEYVKITDIFINCSLVVKHEHFDIRIFEIRRKICGSIYMLIKRTYNCYTLLHTVVIFVLKKSSFKNVHDSKTFIQIAFQIKKIIIHEFVHELLSKRMELSNNFRMIFY